MTKRSHNKHNCKKCTAGSRLARKFAIRYDLTYKCQVNLEATINEMFGYGLLEKHVVEIIDDIYDNVGYHNVCHTQACGLATF